MKPNVLVSDGTVSWPVVPAKVLYVPTNKAVPRGLPSGIPQVLVRGSPRLCAGELDHLGPLLGFGRDEPAEIGGCRRHRNGAEFGKPRLHLGIGESGIDPRVEFVDDLGRRVLGRADSIPGTRLVSRQELSHGRDI